MTVVAFILAALDILQSISTKEPVSWGVAVLMVCVCFRWFWRLVRAKDAK